MKRGIAAYRVCHVRRVPCGGSFAVFAALIDKMECGGLEGVSKLRLVILTLSAAKGNDPPA
jgi:hypothetical protein